MTAVGRIIDMVCFNLVMLWTGAWPSGRVANSVLSRAGRHANKAEACDAS